MEPKTCLCSLRRQTSVLAAELPRLLRRHIAEYMTSCVVFHHQMKTPKSCLHYEVMTCTSPNISRYLYYNVLTCTELDISSHFRCLRQTHMLIWIFSDSPVYRNEIFTVWFFAYFFFFFLVIINTRNMSVSVSVPRTLLACKLISLLHFTETFQHLHIM